MEENSHDQVVTAQELVPTYDHVAETYKSIGKIIQILHYILLTDYVDTVNLTPISQLPRSAPKVSL